MESKHMNNKLFAQYTGINEGTLSLLLRDKAQPTLKVYEAIHKHFPDISMEWLFDGVGPMYKKDVTTDGSVAHSPADGSETSTRGDMEAAASSSTLFSAVGQQKSPVASQNDNAIEKTIVKYVDKPQRKITEIRVFFDDQTWESFVPKEE